MSQVSIEGVDEESVERARQQLQTILQGDAPFTSAERVIVMRAIRSMQAEMQPSLTLDEIREGLE